MLMNLIVSYNLVDLHVIDFCQAFIVEAVNWNRSLINSGLKKSAGISPNIPKWRDEAEFAVVSFPPMDNHNPFPHDHCLTYFGQICPCASRGIPDTFCSGDRVRCSLHLNCQCNFIILYESW